MPRPNIPANFPVASAITINNNRRRRDRNESPWWPEDCETVARRRFIVRARGLTRVILTCNCQNCRDRIAWFADFALGTVDGSPCTPHPPPRETHASCARCMQRRNLNDLHHDPQGMHRLCLNCQPDIPAPPVAQTCNACNRNFHAPAAETTPSCYYCGHVVGQPIPIRLREHSYRPQGSDARVFSADNEVKRIPRVMHATRVLPGPPLPPDPADTPPGRNEPVPPPLDYVRGNYFTIEQFRRYTRTEQMQYWREWRERERMRKERNRNTPAIVVETPSPLFFGCELEFTKPNTVDMPIVLQKIDAVAQGLLYYKRDGSVPDGGEIVTHPFTEAWYRETGKGIFDQLSQTLQDLKCKSHTPGTCGFHIHLTKAAFSNLHIYKFAKFWLHDAPAVEIVSQRDTLHLARWAKLDLNYGGNTIGQIARTKRNNLDRYVAVNVGASTVEIRAFRGNTRAERLHKNIECAIASFHFTKQAPLTGLTWANFATWATDRKKQYPNLVPFLNNHVLPKLRAPEPPTA